MNYLMIFLLLVAAGAALARRVRQRNAALLKHLRKITPYVNVKPPADQSEADDE
mgnify:CR=1 FL=1